MAVKLLAINDVYNIREAKYIVDEENEKDLIPEEDKVQGTRVLVIKGSKEYRMDSNKNWVLIKGEGGGDTLPDVSSTDNGKVLGVVNGEWDKMSAPGGDDFFIINGTLDEEYDSQTDTYVPVFVPDKTADEVVAAMQAGKYLVATAYNANWNETYVMNCVKQQITDSVGGAYTASAYFIGEDNTKKAAAQYLYKTQYYIKFEYQHPADGGGSEPEISWAYSDETFSVPSKGFYQADIRLSTENITPSTTYTVDASISQTQAISKIRTSSLSITLYYSNYSNNAKNYRATNYSIDGSTVYFDVIETISSSSPQITLHKFSWASNNTVTRLGSYIIPIPALPAVTASDNGKVLGVVNGAWNKMAVPGGLPVVTPSDHDKILTVNSSGAWDVGEKDFFAIAGWYNGVNGFDEIVGKSDELVTVPSDREIIDAILNYKDMVLCMHTGHSQPYDDTVEILQRIGFGWETYTRNGEVYKRGWAQFQNIHDPIESAHDMYLRRHDITFYFDTYDTSDPGSWDYLYDENEYSLLPPTTSSDNGKVLGVVDGVWNKITAPSGLPSVTSSDSGSVLQVNSSGAWAKGIKIQEHDYTVTYADGTTATLKNVEVV